MNGADNVEKVCPVPLGNKWREDKRSISAAVLFTAATISSASDCTPFAAYNNRDKNERLSHSG